MERVVTINLNVISYQLEEPAYDALRAYMARAEAALAANPDKAEIVRDLEQAIADKCANALSPGKSVVNTSEMARILEEMGPVEGEGERTNESPRDESGGAYYGPRKRLYRIKDRAVISGVCSGIGAYFDLDPNIIRLIFVLGTLFTSGFGIIVYIVMMFAVPSAHTSEEWAAAHGMPFNAQEVIDRAKREYSRFAEENGPRWRAEARRQRREWNARMQRWENSWSNRGDPGPGPTNPPAKPAGYVTRVFAGLFALIFSIITAALLIAFLVALFALLGTGAMFGWSPPFDAPLWLVIVILGITYAAISAPFSALRRASYATVSGQPQQGGGMTDSLITIVITLLVLGLSWLYWPEARDLMEQSYVVVRDFADFWNQHTDWNWD
jgi:phage shock protein PspC (stress-responsive transcriptional regulator)